MAREFDAAEEQNDDKTVLPVVFDIVEMVVVAFVASILILTLLFKTGYVHGESMEHTMHENDRYIVSDLFYTPKAGDIVVFQPDYKAANEKLFVKRVIAVGGQTVDIKKDESGKYQLYVDNVVQTEPYLSEWQVTEPPFGRTSYSVTVPDGYFFALGDNRVNSTDSRVIGCVDNRRIVGKVIFRFFPFDKIKFF